MEKANKEKFMSEIWKKYNATKDVEFLAKACEEAPFFGQKEMAMEISRHLKTSVTHKYFKDVKNSLDATNRALEEIDEEKDIRKKKLAFKEEVAKAKGFLENTKSKYYDEIKLRPGVTQEQQKAMEFFNRYQEDQRIAEQQH